MKSILILIVFTIHCQSLTANQKFDQDKSTVNSKPKSTLIPIKAQVVNTRKNCTEVCVDSRYLKHYYVKGCKEVTDNDCQCAVRFHCPSNTVNKRTVCEYEGRVYLIGAEVAVRNPCRICYCADREGTAEIDCEMSSGVECPEMVFGLKPNVNCYFAYEKDQCCGHQVCAHTLQPKAEQKICRYRGKEYKKGQKIYPKEDDCKTCICNESWNDTNPLASPACYTYNCEFELNRSFRRGCLPIYHEGACCPIEYKCPENKSHLTQTLDKTECLFDGHKYPIGSRLATKNVCVHCVCRAPPDFTCVHKSCPSPSDNCRVKKWDNSVCCQQYICSPTEHKSVE